MGIRIDCLVASVALAMATALGCGGGGGESGDTGDSGTASDPESGDDGSSGSSDGGGGSGSGMSGSGSGDPDEPLEKEIGFIEIEPVTFVLSAGGAQRQEFTSSPARLWYGFQPADEDPQDKPILVLFNGGPGAASEVLFTFNTTAQSLDEDNNGGGPIGPSPVSWTSAVNVLYVDARTTGYSYNMMDDAANDAARMAEFDTHNFNVFIDGADFVRSILRFLADHPALVDNEVVLVGESYGGVRATAILDLLLDYAAHGDGSLPYEDGALADEVQAHLDTVFPNEAGSVFDAAAVARQFSGQILVQPLLIGQRQLTVTGQMHDQPGSVIFDIASDVGQTFVPCSAQGGGCDPFGNALGFVENTAGRDRFAYPWDYGWLLDKIESIGPKLATVSIATEMFGVDPAGVPQLFAAERVDGYRTPGNAPLVFGPIDRLAWKHGPGVLVPGWERRLGSHAMPLHTDGDFPGTFGDLQPWDTYYLASNYLVLDMFYGPVPEAYGIDPYSDLLSRAFLRNAAYVKTFITNAAYDLVIWGPSIPEAMKQFPADVTNVQHDTSAGEVTVEYADGAFGLGSGETRTIRMPYYEASHTVPLNAAVEILADIEAWLAG